MRMFSTTPWWTGLWELLSPRRCAACDVQLSAEPSSFCAACAPLLEAVDRRLRPPASAAALYLYGGPLAQALQRLKYEGRTELAASLAGLLVEGAGSYRDLVDRVIPLPLFPAKLRRRGYNQAALLARPLARRLGVPCDVDTLMRSRPSAPLAGMRRAQRLEHIRGAFHCRRSVRDRVLVVDDVRTTGATLAEAALTLQSGGAKQVYTLALAFAQA